MSRTAVYPGTFDPVTKGHIDLCERALKMFDHVVIGVADSQAKKPFFSLAERTEMLELVFADFDQISVRPFSGLLIDFARDCNATVIVRGLRAISDFEYEVQLAGMNRSLAPEIESKIATAYQIRWQVNDICALIDRPINLLEPRPSTFLDAVSVP